MVMQKLKEILAHGLDCAATIVTSGEDGPHVVSTWNSYIQIVDDETLHIPAGGLKHTEANLKANPAVILSISNRALQGFSYPGTGVIVKGTAQIIYDTGAADSLKEKFPWLRAVLEVKVKEVTQTL